MTTFVRKEDVKRNWLLIDAQGQTVGRLASRIAQLLRGKHRPDLTPHVDHGDFVVVINADKVQFSGKKWDEKKYYRHSRFFGSLKEKTARQMMEERPTFILEEAIRGMLPKNRLSRRLMTKVKIYAGPEHPHKAQKPVAYSVNDSK
ncbi:MAG: 50S ribosomal protein L13 [Bdellovibrionaceae bacterium]|nr:50S ribosomal protein L13 [Pseudobdellovibrionaceae bacterium]MDW8189737.1 50S ribosomal protein L13 [Pseudobdellovibrionaceae bacterium]